MENFDALAEQIGKENLIALLVLGGLSLLISIVLAYQVKKMTLLIKEENRFLAPNEAWLFAIPFLSIFYNFILIRKITDSLNNEFYDRKEAVDENPTLRQGYYMSFSYLASNFPLPSFIAYAAMTISIVLYVGYIVKIVSYRKLLASPIRYTDEDVESGL